MNQPTSLYPKMTGNKLIVLALAIFLASTVSFGDESGREENIPQQGIVHLIQELHEGNPSATKELEEKDLIVEEKLLVRRLKGQPEDLSLSRNDDVEDVTRFKRDLTQSSIKKSSGVAKGGKGGGGCKKGRK